MAIINNLYMQVDGNNILVHPYTEGNAVWINQSNGYNLMQALEDLRNNAASEWNDVKNKPFNAISGDFKVVGGRLQLNGSFSMEWDSIQNKPTIFNSSWGRISGKPTIFPTDWGMINNKPIIYNSDWNLIGNKPDIYPTNWESIENVPANFNVEWAGVQNRPFFSINLADFDNSINEELSIHNLIHFVEQNSYNSEENFSQYIYQDIEAEEEKFPINLESTSGYLAIVNSYDRILWNYYGYSYSNTQINKNNFNILGTSNFIFNSNFKINNVPMNYICGDDNNYVFYCPENSSYLFANGVLDYKYLIENQIDFSQVTNADQIFNNTFGITHNEYQYNSKANNAVINFENIKNPNFNNIFAGYNNFLQYSSINGRQKFLFYFDMLELLKMNKPCYFSFNNSAIAINDFFSNEFYFVNYNNFILTDSSYNDTALVITQPNYTHLNIMPGSYDFTLWAKGDMSKIYLTNITQPTNDELLLDTNYFINKQGRICWNIDLNAGDRYYPNLNSCFNFYINAQDLYLENIDLDNYSYYLKNFNNPAYTYRENKYSRNFNIFYTENGNIHCEGNNVNISITSTTNKLYRFFLNNCYANYISVPSDYMNTDRPLYVNNFILNNIYARDSFYISLYQNSYSSDIYNITNTIQNKVFLYNTSPVTILSYSIVMNNNGEVPNINILYPLDNKIQGLGFGYQNLANYNNYNNYGASITRVDNINLQNLYLNVFTKNVVIGQNVNIYNHLAITSSYNDLYPESIIIQGNQIRNIRLNGDYPQLATADSILYQPYNYIDILECFHANIISHNNVSIFDFNTDYPTNIRINKINNDYATYIYVIKDSVLDSPGQFSFGLGEYEELEDNNGWYFANTNAYIFNNLTNHKRHKSYFAINSRGLNGFGNYLHPINNLQSDIIYFNPDNTNYLYAPFMSSDSYLLWDDNNNCLFGNSSQNIQAEWLDIPIENTPGVFLAGAYITPSGLPNILNAFCNIINVNNLEEWSNRIQSYNYGALQYVLSSTYIVGSENDNVLDLRFLNFHPILLSTVADLYNIDTIYMNWDHPWYSYNMNGGFRRFSNNIKYVHINNIPEGYGNIDYMFGDCYGLRDLNLNIPVHMANGLCQNCNRITSANIILEPKNMPNFGDFYYYCLFEHCQNLTDVNLTVNLANVDYYSNVYLNFFLAFNNDVNLTNFNFNYTPPYYATGVLGYCTNMFAGTNISSATIPNWVYYGYYMFSNCRNLIRVEIDFNSYRGGFASCFRGCNRLQYMRFKPRNYIDTNYDYNGIYAGYFIDSYMDKLIYIPSVSDVRMHNGYNLGYVIPGPIPNAVALDVPDSIYFDTYSYAGQTPCNVVIASFGNNMNYGGLWNSYLASMVPNLIMGAVPEHTRDNGGSCYGTFSNMPSLVFGIYPPYCDSVSNAYCNCNNLLMFKKVHNQMNCYDFANNCFNLAAIQLPFPKSNYNNGNISGSFNNCYNLRVADLRTCNNIIDDSFRNCYNLQYLYLNDELKKIEDWSFKNSVANLEKIEFNGVLTYYDRFELNDAYKLHYPIKSDGNIGLNFYNCTSLVSSYCGNNTKNMIATYYNCHNLIEAHIGPKVYRAVQTFENCTNLSYAYIGDPVIPGSEIGAYYNTYWNCVNIRTIIWENNNIPLVSLCDTFRNCRNLTTLNEVVINAYTMFNTFIGTPIDDNNIYIYANGYGNVFSYYNNAHRCNLHVRNKADYNYYNLYVVEDQENFTWTPAPEGADYNYYNEDMNVYLYLDD